MPAFACSNIIRSDAVHSLGGKDNGSTRRLGKNNSRNPRSIHRSHWCGWGRTSDKKREATKGSKHSARELGRTRQNRRLVPATVGTEQESSPNLLHKEPSQIDTADPCRLVPSVTVTF